ncbi:MAG: hypothetical protein JNL70_28200 [Saprospiraceae bacterium]|nr:hypothetical protein [Saprospiraceae bacterium]
MDTKNKIVVSCRLDEQLKNDIQTEALEKGLTPSSYIEAIIRQRALNKEADNMIQEYRKRALETETDNERLRAEITALSNGNENINANLTQQCADLSLYNKRLRNKVIELETSCKQLMQDKNTATQTRPYWISETIHQRIIMAVKQLKTIKPKYSEEQLLLLATEVTLKNERAFFQMYKISDFLESNSKFFTFKSQTI